MGFKLGRINNRFGNILDALRGLRLRLVLLVACGILPLTLLVGDILESQRQEELEEARQSVQRLAHEAGHRQADLLSNVSNLLNVLTSIPAVKNHDTDVCGEILADIFAHQRGLTSLWTARPDGSVACADDPAGLQFNMSTRQYFRDALKSGEFVVSNYTVGRLSGRPVLAMALPFKSDGMGADGSGYDGVVFAGVDIDWLYRLAEHRASESEMALVLIDGEGTILAQSPSRPEIVGKRVPGHPLIRAMLASPEGEAELPDLHGIERIFAYVPLGSTGADWRSASTVPRPWRAWTGSVCSASPCCFSWRPDR